MNIPVKKGMLLKHHSRFYFVEDVKEHHSGKQKPTFHIALRDAQDGRHIERSVDELLPLEEVTSRYRNVQYLYAKGDHRVFMDGETFEELEFPTAQLHGCEPFLRDGDQYRVLYAGDTPLSLEMPDVVPLKVTNTAAPSHGTGGATSITKEAVLENGLEVRVPLFVKIGDTLRIDTRTRTYVGKDLSGATF
jgi:elongation factor P